MDPNLHIIYKNLNDFISKYYLYKIIKGLLFIFSVSVTLILLESFIEYYRYLNTYIKTIVIFGTLLILLILTISVVVLPLFSLLKLYRRITFKNASIIIARHFPEIKDKLINTIELGEFLNAVDNLLILASIRQKSGELKPFSFKMAIDFRFLKRNMVFFVISVSILFLILAFSPGIVKEGSVRLVNYSRYYEPLAPFNFILINKDLTIEKNKDFVIRLKVQGEYIPDNAYINIGNNLFLMEKDKNKGYFFFTIKNLNNSVSFSFKADNYSSKTYEIQVLPAPLLRAINLEIFPPSYTGMEAFKILNSGDCRVPAGSLVKWMINADFAENLIFVFPRDSVILNFHNRELTYKRQIVNNLPYSIVVKNNYFIAGDNLKYFITVTPDNYPEIYLEQKEDSFKLGVNYFMIQIKDDYGFHDLKFTYRIKGLSEGDKSFSHLIDLDNRLKNQGLYYYFDFSKLENIENDTYIEYFFELRDNDFINGYKKVTSPVKIYKLLNSREIRKNIEEIENRRDASLNKTKSLVEQMQKDIDDFKKKQLNNELSDWEKKNFLKNVKEKQTEIDKLVKDVLEQNIKSNQINNQFFDEQKNLLEKQKQIQEILEQIMDEELKQLLKEIENLSEKLNEQNFERIKDKLDFSYKDMENRLERSLELLKRYQVEENVLKLAEDLNKLSERQNNLKDQFDKSEKETILQKQDKIGDEFKELENAYKDVIEKNRDLKSPYNIDQYQDQFHQINMDLENLEKDIPKGSRKKIQEKQEKVSDDLQKMAEDMNKLFNEMEMLTLEMNMEDLRQIIDNVVIFSHGQEEVYTKTNKNLQTSPSFPSIIVMQAKIGNDFLLIEDSLTSLMSRIPQLNQVLFKEVEGIKFNISKINGLMEQRNRREALKFQRYVLNSANTVSLILEELMNQLENQMQGSGGGKQKKGKPDQAMQDLKKQQQKLKEELEKLLNQMKNNEGEKNGKEMSDQIVKTLAEQEIFNQMIKQLQNTRGISPESDKKLKEIQKLSEQNVEDLINRNISPELFNRNQKILTRLLESEKAEKEREIDEKRESKEGSKSDFMIPEELKESFKKDSKYKETINKGNLKMKNYYKNLSNDYFRNILK
jgi:hypothetical protein